MRRKKHNPLIEEINVRQFTNIHAKYWKQNACIDSYSGMTNKAEFKYTRGTANPSDLFNGDTAPIPK